MPGVYPVQSRPGSDAPASPTRSNSGPGYDAGDEVATRDEDGDDDDLEARRARRVGRRRARASRRRAPAGRRPPTAAGRDGALAAAPGASTSPRRRAGSRRATPPSRARSRCRATCSRRRRARSMIVNLPMNPPVAGMPARREHRDRQRPGQPRAREADARRPSRCGRRAPVSRSRATITANAARFMNEVDGEVEERRLEAEPRRDDDAGEQVAGLRDRRPREQPLERASAPSAPTLPTTIVIVASAASAGPHVGCASISATSNSRSITPNAAAFVATAMNAVIGVGRALVDVGRPLVERRDRRLERQADDDERDAGEQQRVRREVAARRSRCAIPAKSVEPVAP